MKDIDDSRFFLAIVRGGSLAAASRAFNVTPSAVTQRLQTLEAKLGLPLIDRTARKLQLTDEGEVFAQESEKLVAHYDELIDTLQARRSLVRGHLRVLGTFGFGRKYLAPALLRFQSSYPQLKASLHLTDRWVEAESGNYDVIVHIGELADSSRVAFRMAPNQRLMLASPAYLKRRGVPKTPADLAAHACLLLQENDEDVGLWRLSGPRGKKVTVRVQSNLLSNDGDVIKQWALGGSGIMLRSEWDTAADVAAGRLIRLLPDWRMKDANVCALVPQRKGISARARAFIDFLATEFRPSPPWRRM